MNTAPRRALGAIVFLPKTLLALRKEAGFSLALWALLALLNLAAQIVFRRQLLPGEFAMLNTLLAVVALLTVPVLALQLALAHFPVPPERAAAFRDARLPLVQNFAIAWVFIATPLLFPILGCLSFPRFSFDLFALLNLLFGLGAAIGAALCEKENRLRLWGRLLFACAVVRLLLAVGLTRLEPFAESGLAIGLIAGFITLAPMLRQTHLEFGWGKMTAVLGDRNFRLYLGATLSVLLGLFLFTNGDRIVAEVWFGQPDNNNMGYVNWYLFDGYQAAGLLGRSLLWGTQPLLLLMLVRRTQTTRTTLDSLPLYWLYVIALVAGAFVLTALTQPLSQLFGGAHPELTASFIPSFAVAMIPLGLLQGVGIFSLASRRYPECFVIGGSGLAYTIFLYWFGRPQLLLSCMFGGGVAALMLVLFVGMVRWGRRQP
jgi:hypothetical protein